MFTGIIEEVGTALLIARNGRSSQLEITAPRLAEEAQIGDSIAVNGCCLTVVARSRDQLTFDLLDETLKCTNLGSLSRQSRVNLERALAANSRLDGHFLQGHVDCAARIVALERGATNQRLEIELPGKFAHYVACKGSIAVNGISLTIAEISEKSISMWIIPHTREQTNLETVAPGDLVNLEFDLIAKYLERMLDRHIVRSR